MKKKLLDAAQGGAATSDVQAPNAATPDAQERIAWHPAFVQALQMELDDYRDVLEFRPELSLTSEPLRIDCVVIKKPKGIVIEKNIARIFRMWNIVEYKSPDDYLSVNDFYTVYAYACLSVSRMDAPVTEITVSFVTSSHPGKLLRHLQEKRGYAIAKTVPGIYTVSGDILPMQIIDSRRLSAEENLWLKHLRGELKLKEVDRLSAGIARQGKSNRIEAYISIIARTNSEVIQEAIKMQSALTIEQVFENVGWIEKWRTEGRTEGEARGKAEGRLEIARKMQTMGLPVEQIQTATGLSFEDVSRL